MGDMIKEGLIGLCIERIETLKSELEQASEKNKVHSKTRKKLVEENARLKEELAKYDMLTCANCGSAYVKPSDIVAENARLKEAIEKSNLEISRLAKDKLYLMKELGLSGGVTNE